MRLAGQFTVGMAIISAGVNCVRPDQHGLAYSPLRHSALDGNVEGNERRLICGPYRFEGSK